LTDRTESPRLRTLYPARAGERALTVEDLWRLPRVGAPAPSPTDPVLAVAVKTFDMETNEGKARIWLVPTAGGEPRPLTAPDRDSSQPVFSPDGKRLAFVRKEGDHAQVFVMPLDGGESEKVTDLPLGATDPRWLPDGSGLLCVGQLLDGHLTVEATAAESERRDEDKVKAVVTEERLYRFWDHFLTDGKFTHLFHVDLGSNDVRDLTPEWTQPFGLMEYEGAYDIAPDGSEVAFSALFEEGEPGEEVIRNAVYTIPIGGGAITAITLDQALRAYHPRYAPDGASLVYGFTVDPTFYADRVRLMRYVRASGKHEGVLTDWDLTPGDWHHLANGDLVFGAEIDGRSSLWTLASGSAEPRRITVDGAASAARPGADGRIYFGHQTLQSPTEIHAVIPGGEPERLTGFTDEIMDGIALGEVRELQFEGGGGERIQAWVVLPPGRDDGAALPLVHVIHGGPHGITGDLFHPRWNVQLFAAPGYAVAAVNFQGSTSRGQDFAQRIQGTWGERPYQDIIAATDVLVAEGIADESRMAVTGGSYGGYLVAWIATQTDRFRCIVNHAGVFDLLSQYASDVTHARSAAFGGEPWHGIEGLDRYSPSRVMKDVTTPMLILHGEKDYRVPVSQGFECYNILKAKGVPARLVYFPDENHWVLKPQNSRLWYGEVHAWLARWLGAAAAEADA